MLMEEAETNVPIVMLQGVNFPLTLSRPVIVDKA